MSPRIWTDEDTALARKLLAEHGTYAAVARIMGRSSTTVGDWLQGRRSGGEYRVKVIKNEQMCIPPEVLADRDRRRDLNHRDLTAAFFGDPLPSYSALERR